MFVGLAALAILRVGPALAEEPAFEPLQPFDLSKVEPGFADDMFGNWTIGDADGGRICVVELLREAAIGGMRIEIDPSCEAVFRSWAPSPPGVCSRAGRSI